jgi:hypothetical protein
VIELQRREIGRFRGAVRRCVAGRPRRMSAPIVVQQMEDSLTLSAVLDRIAVSLRLDVAGSPACLVIPFPILANVEKANSGTVSFQTCERDRVRCVWTDRGTAKEAIFEPLPFEEGHYVKPLPRKWQNVEPGVLAALHGCGATTGSAGTPFSLLQLRGKEGRIVGTDGRQLLIMGGFSFPFHDNVLVPAVPVFGSGDFADEREVRMGRTDEHVVIAAGPWTVWLAIDTSSRFPDVTAVISRGTRSARLLISEPDAAAILHFLERAAPDAEGETAVSLRFGAAPILTMESKDARGPELALSRSTCSGPDHVVLVERPHLGRALALGLREVRAAPNQTPVHFVNRDTSYVVASMEPTSVAKSASGVPQSDESHVPMCALTEEGGAPMNREKNGHSPVEPAAEMLDPMVEAEALRAALAEAGRRLGRLVTSLRQIQKRQRVFQTAWSSLQHLQIGTKEKA